MISKPRRTLLAASAAHATHDGYADLIYVLLPIWQSEFALGYATIAVLRGVYVGAMALLQVPAGRLAEPIDARILLVVGTLLAALGYATIGMSGGILGLVLGLLVSGAGSSTQHPIASGAVSRAYGAASRGPLATYNFSGDIGKATIPALTALLLTVLPWRRALGTLSVLGIAVAVGLALFMPPVLRGAKKAGKDEKTAPVHAGGRGGFSLLLAIGILDTSVRMGLLTMLPFLLKAKGASIPTTGFALTLVFIGGAAGKFTCGWLAARVGVLATVLITEGGTAALILAMLFLPLGPALFVLPLLGVMLNGTSSALYGTVPELAQADRLERSFALFYTGTIGGGAVAPVLYGLLSDASSPTVATVATAATALAIFPIAIALAPHLVPKRALA